jgi:hypothetical protein
LAEIVVGVASSHSPQLSSGVDMWDGHGERDRRNKKLLGRDAEFHTYDELLESAEAGRSGRAEQPLVRLVELLLLRDAPLGIPCH